MRKWVMKEFRKQKKLLREDLYEARLNIHLSFDLWMLLNYFAIIAIVVYYIDCHGARQTKLLAMQWLEGEYTSMNIAQAVLNVVGEYRIGS